MDGPAVRPPSWTRPRALRPGDLVGVCAPSGAVDAEALQAGVAALEAQGLRVRLGAALGARRLFTAGSVAERLADLHALFEDRDVAAVFCARGGAGCLQLLAGLDPARLFAWPKPLLGYSDLTALHAFWAAARRVSFHGPMVARDFASGAVEWPSWRAALWGDGPPWSLQGEPLLPLGEREGEGSGVLLGGCLSLLAALVGTPWALQPQEPCVLFLEDWDEPPYRLDRLLWQLRTAGLLDRARALVFGQMPGCQTGADVAYRLEDVLCDALQGLDLPVAVGLPSGHTTGPQATLPLGVPARLSCRAGRARFELLEGALEPA